MRCGTFLVGTALIGFVPRHLLAAMACSNTASTIACNLFSEAALAPASSISRSRSSKREGVTSGSRLDPIGCLMTCFSTRERWRSALFFGQRSLTHQLHSSPRVTLDFAGKG